MGLPSFSYPGMASRQKPGGSVAIFPKASLRSVDGVDYWVLSEGGREAMAKRTPGLDLALSGIRLGDTVIDTSNASSVIDQITSMDLQAQSAESTAAENPSNPLYQSLSQAVQNWNNQRDQTRSDIDTLSQAAQNALNSQQPQSVPDSTMSELASLVQGAQALVNQQQAILNQQGSSGNPPAGGQPGGGTPGTPAGGTTPGQPAAGGSTTQPGTTGTTGTTPAGASASFGNLLGLPWWVWVGGGILGLGALGFFLSSGGKGRGSTSIVIAGAGTR